MEEEPNMASNSDAGDHAGADADANADSDADTGADAGANMDNTDRERATFLHYIRTNNIQALRELLETNRREHDENLMFAIERSFWRCSNDVWSVIFEYGYLPTRFDSEYIISLISSAFIENLEDDYTSDEVYSILKNFSSYFEPGYGIQEYWYVEEKVDYSEHVFIWEEGNPDVVHANILNIVIEYETLPVISKQKILIALIKLGVPLPDMDLCSEDQTDMPLEVECECCSCTDTQEPTDECDHRCRCERQYMKLIKAVPFMYRLIQLGMIHVLKMLYECMPEKVTKELVHGKEYLEQYAAQIEVWKHDDSGNPDPDNPEHNLSTYEYYEFDFDAIYDEMREFLDIVNS
jgi:hypothetical protein